MHVYVNILCSKVLIIKTFLYVGIDEDNNNNNADLIMDAANSNYFTCVSSRI